MPTSPTAEGSATSRKALTALLLWAAPLACLAAGETLLPLQDPVGEYAQRVALPPGQGCAEGATVTLPVTLGETSPIEAVFDPGTGRLRILYRMNFNQLTEGWNWHPSAPAEGRDYYLFKYLPLASTSEDRGRYRAEDKIGTPQEFSVLWRYDYFFAFDNLYDFYPRAVDDDAGFAAEVPVPAGDADRLAHGDLRMVMRGTLGKDCLSDSTTFFKATSATGVDLTVKKRYLIGRLTEIWFYDAASGKALARLAPRPGAGK